MKTRFFVFFSALFFAIAAYAGQTLTTDKIAEVAKQTYAYGEKYGVANVLVVFDLDDTLLAPNQDLGSTAWFEWQHGLAGGSYPGFWEFAAKLNALSGMHTMEQVTAPTVAEIQKKGYKAIILTGRGPDVRSQTEESLRKNNLGFGKSAIGAGFPGEFVPVTNDDLGGLTPAEVESFGLHKPRPVSYENGLFMGAGQHKGALLRVLLHKTASSFRAIVFADDQLRNHRQMIEAFPDGCVDLTTFAYTADRAQLDRFEKSNKKKVIDDVQKLNRVLKEVFPEKVQ